LISSTGWSVRKIYVALSIQEAELKIKEQEALSEVLNYHWDAPEYNPLNAKLDEIRKQKDNIGGTF
jgi:hypothetical protein